MKNPLFDPLEGAMWVESTKVHDERDEEPPENTEPLQLLDVDPGLGRSFKPPIAKAQSPKAIVEIISITFNAKSVAHWTWFENSITGDFESRIIFDNIIPGKIPRNSFLIPLESPELERGRLFMLMRRMDLRRVNHRIMR